MALTACEGVDAVHKGGVAAHLRRHGAEEVDDPLLVLDVHVEVPKHHDSAVGADALPPTRELCRPR